MKTTLQQLLLAGGFCLFCAAPHARATLALQEFDADSHHRFANSSEFIGAPYNWSGVARASNGRWLTMISETYFITANHVYPADGNSVIFHEDNDPTGDTIERTVLNTTRIGDTDIRIGRLNASPGPTIAIYGIASNTTNEANFASSAYANREAFVVGLNDTGSNTTQFRVGRNILDGFDDAYDDSALGPAITFNDDRGTILSLGADESYLDYGDSAAPMFITSGGQLVLVGTNWDIEAGSPNYSLTTFIPNSITAIQTIVEDGGENLTLINVPEPSSVALILAASLSALAARKRS